MKVILRQNFENLGNIGDVVEVKDGYARNYLIPNGIAYTALKGNLSALNEEKKNYEKRRKKELESAEEFAGKLNQVTLEMVVKVGEEGKLYGSVTSQMICDALTEKGFDIDKRKIEIAEPIKQVGIYSVDIKIYPTVIAKIKVLVKEDASEAVAPEVKAEETPEAAPQAEAATTEE